MTASPDGILSRMLRVARRLGLFDDEIVNLREQFYVTLRAYVARIEVSAQPSPVLREVNELLAPGRPQRWSDCYYLEQLLVHLFDERMLRTELAARLLEAETNLSRRQFEHYQSSVTAAGPDVETLRSVLFRLVNDLQWRYTVAEGKRRFSKSLTTRTGIIFLMALAGFGTLVSFAYFGRWQFMTGDLRLFAAAGVAGTWGATFSMLTSVSDRIAKSKIYDLNSSRALTMLAARALVGAGAACVLFLFFCSGVLAGKPFPEIASAPADAPLDPSTVALLVIWCFIAGFSEKLVPSLLAKTESSAELQREEGPSGPQPRYRPTEPPELTGRATPPRAPAAAE